MFNNPTSVKLYRIGTAACLCLFLSGCPTASNPTQPQTPPQTSAPSPPPQTSSSSSSAGNTSSPRQPSQPSSAAQSEGSKQSGETQSQSTVASGDTIEPPEDDARTSGGSNDPSAQSASEGNSDDGDSLEPGFGDGIASGNNLPDLRDEPARPAAQGTASESDGTADDMGGFETAGQPNGETANGGSSKNYDDSSHYSLPAGMPRGSGGYGSPTGMPAGGDGPLTPAEQIAILDAQLEQGAGEFDTMIMETQARQRAAARAQAATRQPKPIASAGSSGRGNSPYEDDGEDSGGYSTGGGMGGASAEGNVAQNTAKYPAPADIPSGNNDDVVARQLREAAMREPDPAVRERLWDEYRNYTGIKK